MTPRTVELLRQDDIPGGWCERRMTCLDRSWTVLLPANADEFLNQLDVQPGVPEPDVYWSQVWPPASLLGQFILRSDRFAGRRVVELGCGIGLPGLAAAAAGAEVTFSDYVPIAVELAVANARRNGFENARGLVLDWKLPPSESFDWVLGSDILYDHHNHLPLIHTLEQILAPAGIAWIGDAGRYHVPQFIERAWQHGFDVELWDEDGGSLRAPTSGKFQLLQLRRLAA